MKKIIILTLLCLIINSLINNALCAEFGQYSFETYSFFQKYEVRQFLENPSIDWLEQNNTYKQRYVWNEGDDYFYVHSSDSSQWYKLNQGKSIWYNTNFGDKKNKIFSKENFLQYSSMQNINRWIKKLGFNKEFENYAILNVPDMYPKMILLLNENETYILCSTVYQEQVLNSKINSVSDNSKILDYEQYELLSIDEFINIYGNGYDAGFINQMYISVNGKQYTDPISIIYMLNEDVGYIEINDIEKLYINDSLSISLEKNTISILKCNNLTIKTDETSIPLTNKFLKQIYTVKYKENKYTILGYKINNKCYINLKDISTILNSDLSVDESRAIKY